MANKHSDELLDFAIKRQQLARFAEMIDSLLYSLLQETKNDKSFADNYADLQKIQESNWTLIKEANALLSSEALFKQYNVKEEFNNYLAHVRHNLRNPINSIKGFTDIVLEDLAKYQHDTSNVALKNAYENLKQKLLQIDSLTLNVIKLIDEIKFKSSRFEKIGENKHTVLDFEKKEMLPTFNKDIPILIVDDVEANCKLLERHLNNLGYHNISIANNGEDALAKKDKISLMLLDIEMPGMSGIEILKQLTKDISDRKLTVIVISGYDSVDKSINCIKLGAEDFLMKPFNADLLRVRVGVCAEKIWLYQKEKMYLNQIEVERQNYLGLLNSVFPEIIVKELTETGDVAARDYRNVAILFIDIVNFTNYCDSHSPEEVLKHLQTFADMCEKMAIKNHLQKLKTIGDSFLAVAGMLSMSQNPVLDCVKCAVDIIKESKNLKSGWKLHTGIHYGNVIGGIVGHRQYLFDIWGDSVNVAARIQEFSSPNTLCLTKSAFEQVKDVVSVESLGELAVKGKGMMHVYKVDPLDKKKQ